MTSLPPYAEMALHPEFSPALQEGVLTLEECLELQAHCQAGWQLGNLLAEPSTRLAALSVLNWEPGLPLFRQ